MTPCPLLGRSACRFYADGCTKAEKAIDYVFHGGTVSIVCRARKHRVELTMPASEFCKVTVRYPYEEDGK